MNRLRIWILGTALGCFAAGMTLGVLVPGVLAAFADDSAVDGDEEYVRKFTADFGLDAAQQATLRMVLSYGRKQELNAFRKDFEQLPLAVRNEVGNIRSQGEQRIRALLRTDQRQHYDAMSRLDTGGGR